MIIDHTPVDRFIALAMINGCCLCRNVLTYGNASEALQYLQENQQISEKLPDVIFLELYMPMMTGLDFMKAFEQLSESVTSKCRVFLLSSAYYVREVVKTHDDARSVAGFHEKPITREFLYTL